MVSTGPMYLTVRTPKALPEAKLQGKWLLGKCQVNSVYLTVLWNMRQAVETWGPIHAATQMQRRLSQLPRPQGHLWITKIHATQIPTLGPQSPTVFLRRP